MLSGLRQTWARSFIKTWTLKLYIGSSGIRRYLCCNENILQRIDEYIVLHVLVIYIVYSEAGNIYNTTKNVNGELFV